MRWDQVDGNASMIFFKQTCLAVGYPFCKITTYLHHGISQISKPSFKINKQWKLIAKSKQKWYVQKWYFIIIL